MKFGKFDEFYEGLCNFRELYMHEQIDKWDC